MPEDINPLAQFQVRLKGLVLSSDTEGSKYWEKWVVLKECRDQLDMFPYDNQRFSSMGHIQLGSLRAF